MRYLFVLLLLIVACNKPILKGDLIISNVNIVDVKNGEIHPGMDIVILNDTIQNIAEHGKNKLTARRLVDATGQYVIPGLWDMHVHTWFALKDHIPLLLANGVTGVRDMFGAPSEIKKIKEQSAIGILEGPSIVASGAIIDGKNYLWPGSDAANTAEEGRRFVRQQLADGADFIKVYSGLKPEVFMAIAAECKKFNVPFCGHVPSRVRLEDAVNAGMLSSEHFFGILEFTSSKREEMYARVTTNEDDSLFNRFRQRFKFVTESFDRLRVKDLISVLRNGNMYLTPTSVVNRSFALMNDTTFTNDSRKAYLPDYLLSDWNPVLTSEDFQIERNWYKLSLSLMKEMVDGGVQFLAGTDYGNPYVFPGFSLHDELEIFVRDAHFTPLQALQTATINPAVYLRRGDTQGSVELGRGADLVILAGDPLKDITNTRKIRAVVQRGKYDDGDTLRSKLEDIAKYNRLPRLSEVLMPLLIAEGVDAAFNRYSELKVNDLQQYNSSEEQLNAVGYDKLSNREISDAIKVFELNILIFPKYANGFDSLGDAYVESQQFEKAIVAYNKAVSLGSLQSKVKVERLKSAK